MIKIQTGLIYREISIDRNCWLLAQKYYAIPGLKSNQETNESPHNILNFLENYKP